MRRYWCGEKWLVIEVVVTTSMCNVPHILYSLEKLDIADDFCHGWICVGTQIK